MHDADTNSLTYIDNEVQYAIIEKECTTLGLITPRGRGGFFFDNCTSYAMVTCRRLEEKKKNLCVYISFL